MFRLS
jgi:hypothetical protein